MARRCEKKYGVDWAYLAGDERPFAHHWCGGIRTAADVQAKLDAGASLVQLYTSLIYEGPNLPGHLLRELARLSQG
ncbi:MAG: hypothetical protein R3D55_16985 [Chloroflexota bacterium]